MPKKNSNPASTTNTAEAPHEEKPKAKAKAKPEPEQATKAEAEAPNAAAATPTPQPAPENATAGNSGGPAVAGVRPMRTRPYLAGVIIAKHGLAAGVTDAMVAELDAAYGKPNPRESQFCLKNAHHAARGYMGYAEDAIA